MYGRATVTSAEPHLPRILERRSGHGGTPPSRRIAAFLPPATEPYLICSGFPLPGVSQLCGCCVPGCRDFLDLLGAGLAWEPAEVRAVIMMRRRLVSMSSKAGRAPRGRRSGYFSLHVIARGFAQRGDGGLPLGAARYDRFCRGRQLGHPGCRADFAY
jgi:hypothetical protein